MGPVVEVRRRHAGRLASSGDRDPGTVLSVDAGGAGQDVDSVTQKAIDSFDDISAPSETGVLGSQIGQLGSVRRWSYLGVRSFDTVQTDPVP